MSLKSEKSIKIEHRNLYMLHRLDIQRLSGKKQSKFDELFHSLQLLLPSIFSNNFFMYR